MFGVFSMFLQLNWDVLSCDHKDPNAFTRGSISSWKYREIFKQKQISSFSEHPLCLNAATTPKICANITLWSLVTVL